MPAEQQFTSGQILEAARRAEAEGKLDYALQFYRHIVDHHGTSAEVRAAREGFERVAGQRQLDELRRRGAIPPVPVAHRGNGASPPAPREAPPAHSPRSPHRDEPRALAGSANLPQVVTRAEPRAVELHQEPEFGFKERYRAGTTMAQGANWLGWLAVGMGVAFGAAGLAGIPKVLAVPAVFGLPAGVAYGLGAAVAGLTLVFLSQLALAVFDNANASRHLLAIERAKAEL